MLISNKIAGLTITTTDKRRILGVTISQERGFIALLSILILSVMLLGMTLSLAQFGLMSRFSILALEERAVSERYAHACVSYVRILVFNDPMLSFTVPREFQIDASHKCTVLSIFHDKELRIVRVQGIAEDIFTNREVVVDSRDGRIISSRDISAF